MPVSDRMNMKYIKRISIAVFLLAVCQLASGWGGEGHRIVVAIAERHLSQRALDNISRYIPAEDLIKESVYMDIHRKDSNLLYAYNFHEQCINLKTMEYDPNAHVDCGDISRALWLADYNLSHLSAVSDSIVQLNLRMLLHFVGELHCPVHLGIPSIWQPKPPFRKDFGKWYWRGKNVKSFHAFIDRAPRYMFPDMTPEQVAESIDRLSRREARKVVKGDFTDWTNDSVRGGFRIYDSFPPLWEIPDTPEAKHIPDDYLDRVGGILTEELVKAGYQLAELLNRYFDKAL